MEAVLLEKTKIKKRYVGYQSAYSGKQHQAAENRADTMRLRALAQKLDNAVVENDITMQEIVDEVNAVRKERYEKQNRI